MMKPVFLIGFMGAGKTTLGRGLACRYPALTYVDLDGLIEERTGMSVSDIFARHGEAFFRKLEAAVLREQSMRGDVIVGCGGGTPCHSGNMELMNACGVTVLLQASFPVLLRRLVEAQGQRPLLAGMSADEIGAFIVAKQAERAPFYDLARFRFVSDRLETPDEIDASCRSFFNDVILRSCEGLN